MLSKGQIQFITSLHHKKYREENGCFIAEGTKIVVELMESDFQVRGVYASAEWIVSHIKEAGAKEIPIFETLPHEMTKISALSTPGPVLAVVTIPSAKDSPFTCSLVHPFTDYPDHPFTCSPVHPLTGSPVHLFTGSHDFSSSQCLTLALDDIRDPGNLGTIIRIADWFGVDTILCSMNCVDEFNPKVVQATMGSIARVRVVRCDLEKILAKISGQNKVSLSSPHLAPKPDSTIPVIPVYGACLDGENIYSSENIQRNGIILIGNESHGISENLLPLITHKITIPTFHSDVMKRAESLNASVATAIILAEFFRRFGFNPVEKQTL